MHFRENSFMICRKCILTRCTISSSCSNEIEISTCLLGRREGYMLTNNVIFQQGGYPGSVRAVRTRVERFHLAEEVHVLPQTAPVAVSFRALEALQLVFAASPNFTRQFVAEESQLGWNTIRVSCKHNDKHSWNRENIIGL